MLVTSNSHGKGFATQRGRKLGRESKRALPQRARASREFQEARYGREQAFHDHRYATGGRRSAAKYLSVGQAGTAFAERVQTNEPGARVLDYGCGRGLVTAGLARRGYDVTAIDLSVEAVRQARELVVREGLEAEIHVMNAESLEFDDAGFDLVCGRAILHHLDLETAYAEIARVLKPDGRAVFLEPLAHNPFINLYRRLTPSLRTSDEHPLRLDDIWKATEYFGHVRATFWDFFVLAGVPFRMRRGSDRLVAGLAELDRRALRRTRFRRFAWKAVIECDQPL
jgi:SAM-dependent methyltransferase